ncbi:MAG: flagellin [Proteobacteria bacterium]|nr:flagellin [Pseudomonadota bacterium]
MGMRIRTNVPAITAQRFMSDNKDALNKNLERLSSGYRINRSSDDAAGLAISESLRGKIRGLNVAKRNANDAVSMVQVAEGSMNEMTNILIRLRELSVQASTDTLGEREKGFLNREYTQLADELDRIGNSTEFNGIKIFDEENDKDQFVIQVGTNGTTPDMNEDTISISLAGLKFSTESLGLGKGDEIGPSELGTAGPSRDEISGRLTTIDDALSRISNERATLGSVQSRLNSALSNLSINVENMETAKSRIKDVDFASETAELTQNRILVSSTTSVLSQANQAPEQVLQLLR